jgi:hypothetical protein
LTMETASLATSTPTQVLPPFSRGGVPSGGEAGLALGPGESVLRSSSGSSGGLLYGAAEGRWLHHTSGAAFCRRPESTEANAATAASGCFIAPRSLLRDSFLRACECNTRRGRDGRRCIEHTDGHGARCLTLLHCSVWLILLFLGWHGHAHRSVWRCGRRRRNVAT